MNRFKIGVIIFCTFLGGNAAGSNSSFNDTISIPGAKCIISLPIDSNSLYASFKHPCSNYYFFNVNFKESWGVTYAPLTINFITTAKCSLFVKQISLFNLPYMDTLPLSCDSINNYYYNSSTWLIDTSDKISIGWQPPAPAVKRLANTIMSYAHLRQLTNAHS